MKNYLIIGLSLSLVFSSCSKEESENPQPAPTSQSNLTVPTTYSFTRLGVSTVDYSGQTSRLNQLEEIAAEIKKVHGGTTVSSQLLLDMFANSNNPFSQVYPKDLKSKTFSLDSTYFKNLLIDLANNSSTTQTASNGTAGWMTRKNGQKILVDAGGKEYLQLIEKGLMGATFYHQIANTYLSQEKIGLAVDNSSMVDSSNGKYYTSMEHHFDEAFGYLGVPEDFQSNYSGNGTIRFWGKYANSADPLIQINDKLMNAFKTGRAAIVAKDYNALDIQVNQIHLHLETLIAATAIHYINESLVELNTGERHHFLSEAYAFTKALRYSNFNHRKLSASVVTDLWQNKIGENLYNSNSSDLLEVKNTLAQTYGLSTIKDQL